MEWIVVFRVIGQVERSVRKNTHIHADSEEEGSESNLLMACDGVKGMRKLNAHHRTDRLDGE